MVPRKSFSVAKLDDNGNGKVYISINLKLFHWILVVVGAFVSVIASTLGVARALAPVVVDPAISSWVTVNHIPIHEKQMQQIGAKIDIVNEKVERNRVERDLQIAPLAKDLTEVKADVKDIRDYLLRRSR